MFPAWAIVEVMGHNRYAGYVSQEVFAGVAFVRVDVPETTRLLPFTKLVGPSSIFGITPCTEEVARKAAEDFWSTPHNLIDISKPRAIDTPAIAAADPTEPHDPWEHFDDDEEDDDREDYGEGAKDGSR